jgi:hypothetical protein
VCVWQGEREREIGRVGGRERERVRIFRFLAVISFKADFIFCKCEQIFSAFSFFSSFQKIERTNREKDDSTPCSEIEADVRNSFLG